MAFAWSDIERELERKAPAVYEALRLAYGVEAVEGANNWGDPHTTGHNLRPLIWMRVVIKGLLCSPVVRLQQVHAIEA
jgi:hypothetical protein